MNRIDDEALYFVFKDELNGIIANETNEYMKTLQKYLLKLLRESGVKRTKYELSRFIISTPEKSTDRFLWAKELFRRVFT